MMNEPFVDEHCGLMEGRIFPLGMDWRNAHYPSKQCIGNFDHTTLLFADGKVLRLGH